MSTTLRPSNTLCPSRPKPSLQIELTPTEDKLFTLLDDCTKYLREKYTDLVPVECRIAGGWVRDKLLGLESNDIDVALSTMMGVPFAEHLVSFLASRGIAIKDVAKVAMNPDQSKHLETAMVNVLGLDIDFVNMRSEVYAENSRIPAEVSFGTPLQDAMRRDITINALFYNVHTRSVEDYTGRWANMAVQGLEDLKAGIIRTPLAPRETFMDDPLRILRCIRFASRFEYSLDNEAKTAMVQHDIQEALAAKISRERVGIEVDKMLKGCVSAFDASRCRRLTRVYSGKNPLLPLQMIDSLGLHEQTFWLPPEISSSLSAAPRTRSLGLASAAILHTIFRQFDDPSAPHPLPSIHKDIIEFSANDKNIRRRLYMAAALTPYRGITFQERKKTVTAMEGIARYGLKLGNANYYMDGIPALFAAAAKLSIPILSKFTHPSGSERVALGLALRDKNVHNETTGSHWTTSLLFSLVQDLVETINPVDGKFLAENIDLLSVIETYNMFISKVLELGLPSSVHNKPILDGREVCAALGLKPGPHTGHILNSVTEWQLEHPDRDKAACEQWLRDEHGAGRLMPAPSPDGKRVKGEDESRKVKKPKTKG
ncbi:uncharacterized protein EI90DRAFT_2916098 [Cantharellus anzutake]|uniref:uncharacterized protein n=1 Tax=Cantharellus anzutake TaxID=1750568 RepID=UPI0019067BC1|nr:uncharacterized protein EI90DRAFT_2916098 [Cantharellus anzutake]KAF8334245.1 hypothetical protein EI90DRAFT_2916098 [Cantharellus anzutake]